ncbi:hypothetical protein [Aureibacter tunicatorum]|uniref:Uncharacterized protein n=1 Tax=Aureibacter tunicatorum TaxID=866807 RepID=A0AAE4BRN5_9BACT|nr:hypothetical protein [Aureibacter tunicatorum]MDR6238108.1 hypothetical protein [Aureibacter tunicatorum]BDD03141.1 hypothetical protein AUTU_06240 [Aureibacter tunicatorum]
MKVIAMVTSHDTKIYEIEPKGKAKSPNEEIVTQTDRDGFRHHIHHKQTEADFQPEHFKGQRTPEYPEYMHNVAKALDEADKIILAGHGDGHSNEANKLDSFLKKHNLNVSNKVVELIHVDSPSTTELILKGREIFNMSNPKRRLPPQ